MPQVAMKIPSSGKLRRFRKVAVACVFLFNNIPIARLEASDISSGSGSVGKVDCEISEADKAFGIQVISDVACAAGGLGCFDDHCRYCKVIDTLKSAHLESCESYGTIFPTMAPLTVSTSTCIVSSGDAAVGVGGMTDSSCLYGGIGCFNDHCRFCQSELSPQSSFFLLCSWVKGPGSGTESSNDFAGFIEDSTTGTPRIESMAVVRSDVCSLTATYGNIAVGIDITSDAACASGGVGCIDNICRFCKAKDTTQSAHLNACPVITKVCTTRVSDGDAAVGINIVTDTSCAQGGMGCIDSVCRFCRTASLTQSVAYIDCVSISNTTTQIPATSTAPVIPVVPAPVPAPAPTTTAMQSCSQTVSDGDAAVGIKIVTDTSCVWGGLGCIDQICRFCRVTTTIQSGPFVDCATLGGTTTTPALGTTAPINSVGPTTLAPTKAPVPTTSASTKVPAPTTVASTKTPTATTAAPTKTPVLTTVAPTKTPGLPIVAPTSTPTSTDTPSISVPPTAVCGITAAVGDVSVGIDIVTDISCVSGGLGCIDSVCRFCRVTASTQSAAYVDCAVITSATHPPTLSPTGTARPATPATPATPTPTPTIKLATSPSVVFVCTRTASSGDKGVGLDVVSDVRCSEGGTGCLDEVCRFCKRFNSVQSQSYLDCSTIPPADIGSDITFVRIPIDTINKTTPSERKAKSSQESTSVNTIVTLHRSATVKTEMDHTCANVSLAEGQAAGGIGVVLDTTNCPEGLATGCVGNEGCRYCMRFPTSVSESLDYCAIVNGTAVAYALSGLPPSFNDEKSVFSAEAGSAETLSEVKNAITAKATVLTADAPRSVFKETSQWFTVAAACVGAVVFVALVTFSLYKTNTNHPSLVTSSPKEKRVSPDLEVVVMSNSSDPGDITDV